MWKVVDDRSDGEPALYMKGRLEFARREHVSVDAPEIPPEDFDEEARATFAAGEAGIPFQFPNQRIATHDFHGIGGIDGFRRIRAPVHRLTVVAMAEELHDRLGADFDFDRAAATLNLGHCSILPIKTPPLAPDCPFGRKIRPFTSQAGGDRHDSLLLFCSRSLDLERIAKLLCHDAQIASVTALIKQEGTMSKSTTAYAFLGILVVAGSASAAMNLALCFATAMKAAAHAAV
jgi:hypothetical protein